MQVFLWVFLHSKCCILMNLSFCQPPTCGELSEWVKVFLNTTLPSAELTDLDPKCLLATVTKEDVQRVVDGKKTELARLEKMVENK